MNSAISEALHKVRPDLNKDKKFRALTAERRAALVGNYRDPDAEPAKEGELNAAEIGVGSEINRMLANDAQRQLAANEAFFKRHATTLAGFVGLAALGLIGFGLLGRGDVKARMTPALERQVASVTPAATEQTAQQDAHGTAHVAGKLNVQIDSAKPVAVVAPKDEDEIPVMAHAPALVAKETASLSPLTRDGSETTVAAADVTAQADAVVETTHMEMARELIPATVQAAEAKPKTEKAVAALLPADTKAAAPGHVGDDKGIASAATVVKQDGFKATIIQGDGLEDGASVANASSLDAAGSKVPVKASDAPTATATESAPAATGEVLYESAPVPSASAARLGAAGKSKRAKAPSTGDNGDDASGELRVSGIFWDKTRPLALINDKIVEIGSTVAGAKVTAIEPNAVTLSEGGKVRTLHP